MKTVWIWQQMLSPHMLPLAQSLAQRGVTVRFLAAEEMAPERAAQGWAVEPGEGVELVLANDALSLAAEVAAAPSDTVHLTQGIVRNAMVGRAQALLAARGAEVWWMAETVDRRGALGWLKDADYRRVFKRRAGEAARLLAIGSDAARYFARCGFDRSRIVPFAYFLRGATGDVDARGPGPLRILFAARMIGLKRFDVLVDALAAIEAPFALDVIGDGPLAARWRGRAQAALGDKIAWHGGGTPDSVRNMLGQSDLLVSPSDYDGWSAVLSEALIEGTRAICSDACGASDVVASAGTTFPAGDVSALRTLIEQSIAKGGVEAEERRSRRRWAQCLTADAGADYLLDLMAGKPSAPPWLRAAAVGQAA